MTVDRTSRRLPCLGIGAGSLANAGGEAAFAATVQTAWNNNIRYFDTSAFYLGGESERRLGAALARVPRQELLLSTKLGRYQNHTGPSIDPESKRSWFDYSAKKTAQSIEQSLERLKVDRLDLVFIHDLDRRLCGERYDELLDQALTGAYPTLRRFKEDGVIRNIGIATMDWRACLQFAELAEVDAVMPAGEYSLLRTNCTPLLDFCRRNNIRWIAASPLNSGILATGAVPGAFYNMRPATQAVLDQVARIEAICAHHGVPLVAAAMQYPLRHPAVSTVVFGAKSPAELRETHALFHRELPNAFWSEIEAFVLFSKDWEGLER